MSIIIRPTALEDHEPTLEVVRSAFSHGDNTGKEQVDIVIKTWAERASPEGFDLVAVEDAAIVGHVLAARGELAGEPALGIAPLCVAPGCQRTGIGVALMHELLGRIERAGWPFVLLLGNPAYYQRFGFESASDHNIHYPPVGTSPAFQIRIFENSKPMLKGAFTYCFE